MLGISRKTGWAVVVVATLLVGGVIGYTLRGPQPAADAPTTSHATSHVEEDAGAKQVWTCSMHPQVRQNEPGKCPICGMDLILATGDGESAAGGVAELTLSSAARKLAAIATTRVERKFVAAEVRLVGKVAFDETRVRNITAWIPGRLDRLYVDYTGVPVKKGDHLVSLYSPQLLTAQEELLAAIKAAKEPTNSGLAILEPRTVREKLRLWGLTKEQIAEIEKRGTPTDHMTIYAPIGGIVVKKHAVEGSYVKTGEPVYTIADFSQVWVLLEAYESDLVWIRYGQEVELRTESHPGEVFKGIIVFIDPALDEKTRTVKVRVNVPNETGKLKPGMFAHATVSARLAADGKVLPASLAGKWMCPMHPDVVADQAGKCPQCEMPLVRAETLGYAADGQAAEPPLVIPVSAALLTGKRAVVYVALDEEGKFEGREVVLGPRAGDYYLVREGLNEGERVVTRGNFKLDSAMQLLAKPSMMSPAVDPSASADADAQAPTAPTESFDTPEEFRGQIDGVLKAYFRVQQALSKDDAPAGRKKGAALAAALKSVEMGLLTGDAHMAWMKSLKTLEPAAAGLGATDDIVKQREHFDVLSRALASVVKRFGSGGAVAVLQFHCPMAFDNRGADWLQDKAGVENPYFGDMMFGCGEQTATLAELK